MECGEVKQAMRLQENREILRMSRPVLVGTLFFAVLLSACLFGHVARAATNVVVSPAHLQEWQSELGAGGLPADFIIDTSVASSRGALRLQTIDDETITGQSTMRFMTALHGVSLLSVLTSQAGYVTKQDTIAPPSSLPSYQIDVLPSGQATPTTLIYEPYLDSSATAIRAGVWQHWDVDGGTFRSTRTVNNLTTTGRYTLAEVSNILPGATVLSIGVGMDSGSAAAQSKVGNLVFNETAYDFEPDVPATPQNFQLYSADSQAIACGATTNSETIGLRWGAVAGDIVKYEYDVQSSDGISSLIDAGLQTTATVPIMSDGQWLLRVRAVNFDGITSDWSSGCAFYIDRTAPILTMDVGANSSATYRVISGTTDDAGTLVTVTVDGVSYGVSPEPTGDWILMLDGLSIGMYEIEVTSVDVVGNAAALSAHIIVEVPVQVMTSDAQLDEAIDALSQPFNLPQSISSSLSSTIQQPRITPSDIRAIESQIKNNSSNSNGSDIASKNVIATQSNEGWQLFGIAWYWWVLSILGGAVGIWYFKPTRAT